MIDLLCTAWTSLRNILLEEWFIPLTIVIGGLWTIINLLLAKKDTRKNNELLNQPNFVLIESMGKHREIPRSCDAETNSGYCTIPSRCGNSTCKRLHWFDIKNIGNFPAEQISISLSLQGEQAPLEELRSRMVMHRHLQSGESFQYSTKDNDALFTRLKGIPFEAPTTLYAFLQYKSGYSNYWYRRVYKLYVTKQKNSSPKTTATNCDTSPLEQECIILYKVEEQNCKCQKNVCILQKVLAYVKRGRCVALREYANNWVVDFLELSKLHKLIAKLYKIFAKPSEWGI